MDFPIFLQLIRQKRKTVFGIIALFLVIAAVFVAFQRFKYSSKSQLLVVQEHSGVVDAYTASKSSEHLSSVLASVVGSNSFFTKVTTNSPSINVAYFGSTPKEQIKEWRSTVKAQSINDSGIIAITIYHPNRGEAEKIAGAVNYVLMTQHSAYDGAGEAVKVRLIDQPVTSSIPVKPNLILITITALFLGFVVSLMYIYVMAEGSLRTYQMNSLDPKVNSQGLLHEYQKTHVMDRKNESKDYTPRVDRTVPHQAMTGLHSERFEQPATYRPQAVAHHPYGQKAHVNLEEVMEMNELENSLNPEEIIRQGRMKNIID